MAQACVVLLIACSRKDAILQNFGGAVSVSHTSQGCGERTRPVPSAIISTHATFRPGSVTIYKNQDSETSKEVHRNHITPALLFFCSGGLDSHEP